MELTVQDKAAFAATGGVAFDAKLPAICFIHGASFDRTVWRLQARYFAWHGYAVLAVDLPGHGKSDGPALTSIADMTEWLWQFLAAAGVDQVRLVGHSLGSLVALEAAAQQPERVRALSLVGSAYPMAVSDPLLQPARENDHVALERLTSWAYGRAAELGGSRTPGLWMTGNAIRILEHSANDLLYHDLNACNNYDGGEAAAQAVQCPVQFLLGQKDIMTPVKRALSFAGNFQDPVIDIIPGAGHIMMEECPDATLDALIAFMKKV